MKKTGFIDLHFQSALHTPEAVHIFKESGTAADFEKTVVFGSGDALADITAFYVSLPVHLLNFRIIHLPFSDREKLKKVIPLELENLILEGSEKVVFDTVLLNGDESNAEVLVAYAEKALLQQILETLARYNIDPCVITSIDLRAAVGPAHTGGRSRAG